MKGTPFYTHYSVAFPSTYKAGLRHWEKDEISVSLLAKDGGTHGEFTMTFPTFGLREESNVHFHVFPDGYNAFMDSRVQPAIKALVRKSERVVGQYGATHGLTAEEAIEILERYGIKPDKYTLAGRNDPTNPYPSIRS